MCLTDDQYINHERKMSFINMQSSAQASIATTMVMALAMAGTIDARYVDERNALRAAKYVLNNTSYCVKANYATTGSFVLEPTDLYVLLLNGALEYLDKGGDDSGDFD
jgi:hypothetical protein